MPIYAHDICYNKGLKRRGCLVCGEIDIWVVLIDGNWYPFCCLQHKDEITKMDRIWLPLISLAKESDGQLDTQHKPFNA